MAIKQGLKEGDNVIGKIDEIFALIKGLDQKQIIRSLGIGIAVMAFVVLRTVVTAWHAGVEASIANRLITRTPSPLFFLCRCLTATGSLRCRE